MKMRMAHEFYMHHALAEAVKAAEIGEVPIGAVAAAKGRIIARAHNVREATEDPFGHAEILLLKKLAKKLGVWRMEDAAVYVTCEPCIMCMGALLQARIPRLIFGCMDTKAGACGSLYDLSMDMRLNHRIEVVRGVLADECGRVLKDFFKGLRR